MHHVFHTPQNHRPIIDHMFKKKIEDLSNERGVKCHTLSMMTEEKVAKKRSKLKEVADN